MMAFPDPYEDDFLAFEGFPRTVQKTVLAGALICLVVGFYFIFS